MEVQKFFNKKIELEYFFIVGKVKIDSKYFIDKINVGIEEKDNMSHITNVKGSMTRWDFFNNDENFLNVLSKFINYVDDNLDLMKYRLKDSWGLKLQKFENTSFHNHMENPWSGVLYLNSSNQELIFPQIKQEVKPDEGVFCLFSGLLDHGCKKNMHNTSKYGIAFNMKESKPY
jgi:hypothetical protein|tara:strand:- start:94 stop:615 length:522 start_codon:yes stop_codon:yes gene_type:complete